MSVAWQIENTYFKIHVDSSGTSDLFNIASCENFLAYWDCDCTNTKLNIYNIPNNFTKISNIQKLFTTYSRSSELRLDINKNGQCIYFIDGKVGFFSFSNCDIASDMTYDLSYTTVVIGTDKGFIKHKNIDNKYKIQYFDINNTITNNKITLIDLFVGELIIDKFTTISIYDNDLVIGSPTTNSGYGVMYVYDNKLSNPTMFSYTQSMTYFGFQISTFHNQIVVRSFRSTEYSEVDNIPVFIYVKTNNVYNLRSQYAINKLSQVFVCQTSDGTSHYITNTYEHGNLDRRINIRDTNNQKTTVFFNGNPMNQSFRRPTNDFLVERRDIAVNDTFLFVRTTDFIHVYANGLTLTFPNETHGFLPLNGNILLYNKKGANTVLIDNDIVSYDFSSEYFNPHKFYVSNDYLANRTYDTVTISKYIDGEIDVSSSFPGGPPPVQHNFFDNNNEFIAYNVSEFFLHETLYDDVVHKYNKFDLFFNGEANIDEWEFLMFYKPTQSDTLSQPNTLNIVYTTIANFNNAYVFNNKTSLLPSEENSDHVCIYERPYLRASGENPLYENETISIDLIKESRKYEALLHKSNSFRISKRNINYDKMPKRKANAISLSNTNEKFNRKSQFFTNYRPTYPSSNFDFNNYKPFVKTCYSVID
tara:strand:+ start:1317 stop:3254 length:1938 start_codon:yes stop_codon:yes gene_type:complete